MGHFALKFALFFSLALVACGGSQPKVASDPRGTLRFHADVQKATLEIDETRLGPIALFKTHGVMLRPGTHRIVVRCHGYFDVYRLVEVVENQVETIEVILKPIPK